MTCSNETVRKLSRYAALSAVLATFFAPLFASAADVSAGINLNVITPYSNGIIYVINYIIVPVFMALAFIVFLWGIYRYFIYGADNETERTTGKQFALWGTIGFVIILSLWGIVNLFMGALGLSAGIAPPYPTIGGTSAGGNPAVTLPLGTPGTTNFGQISPSQSVTLRQSYDAMQTACAQNMASNDCQLATQSYTQVYNAIMGTNLPVGSIPASALANGAQQAFDACRQQGSSVDVCEGIRQQFLTDNVSTGADAVYNACIAQSPGDTATCTAIRNQYVSDNAISASTAANCPVGCSPGTLNPNQCVDSAGEVCAGSGTTSGVPGCTDPGANNQTPGATVDNGTCTYDSAL